MATSKTDSLEAKIRAIDRLSKNTQDQYVQRMRVFAEQTGKTAKWTREDVLGYFRWLEKKTTNKDSVIEYYYVMLSVFKIAGEKWPITTADLKLERGPRRPQPVVDVSEIEKMISYAKSAEAKPEHMLLVAISTTYGLRREELHRLTVDSFTDVSMKVDTAKHGLPREHMIAEAIMPYVSYGLSRAELPIPVTTLSLIYHKMRQAAGCLPVEREGWHSIRRALDTDLVDAGLPDRLIENYMRWAAGAKGGMVGRYYTSRSGFNVDKRVFEVHPYLGFWE